MPIYEFICEDCNKPFETLVMGFKTDEIQCPECESKNINKLVSSFAVKGNVIGSGSFNSSVSSCNTGST